MKRSVVVGALAVVCTMSCSSSSPSTSLDESAARSSSAIQGGATDTTHDFAVGVIESVNQAVSFCSGVLLGPNLVATARHCISRLTSTQIDCATSAFAATLPTSNLLVTLGSMVHSNPPYGVAKVIVPPATGVCGNDIALLILSQSVHLPQYVTPAISPPMTDHHAYTTSVTAIGYGIDTPADLNGTSAGVRRIRQDINLSCIPNDKTFTDCFSFQNAQRFISANEFEGGDGTCEGDSGSGAFDQGSFDRGQWVAFGILSRGSSDPEAGTCLGSVYTRFDAWGQLLIDAAAQAASMGGYSPPSWTGLPSQAVDASSPSVSNGSRGEGGTACLSSGTLCDVDTDCCSAYCISYGGAPYTCACDMTKNTCSRGYACERGVCVPGSQTAEADAGKGATVRSGCSVIALESGNRPPWNEVAMALGCALVAAVRRRRRCRKFDRTPLEGDA